MTAILTQPIEVCNKLFSTARHITVDAEWCWQRRDGMNKAVPLSVQLALRDADNQPLGVIVVLDETLPQPSSNPLNTLAEVHPYHGKPLVVVPASRDTIQNGVLRLFNLSSCPHTLTLYYSLKDVEFCVGDELIRALLVGDQRKINKKRNINGTFTFGKVTFKLLDRIGMFNSSLEAAIRGVGIDPLGKDLVKTWSTRYNDTNIKSRMDVVAMNHADEFLTYAIGDVVDLDFAVSKRIEQVNTIVADAFGFNPGFTFENIPGSSGKFVWEVFKRFLMHKYPRLYRKTFQYTDSFSHKDAVSVQYLRKLDVDKYDKEYTRLNERGTIIHGLAMGSIPNMARIGRDTGVYGAVVHGGRCVNEDWRLDETTQRINNVIDVDLSSCYGTALEGFRFPIGIPTIIACANTKQAMRLGEVLDKYGNELVPGLWVAYLEGLLPFDQDLIISKYGLSAASIMQKILGRNYDSDETSSDVDVAHIKGDFVLTTQQINLGVLTDASLKVLKAVCTNTEWAAIRDLRVPCLIYYPRNQEMTHKEFTSHKVGDYDYGLHHQIIDPRSRAWTSIGLNEFISPLKTLRGTYKRAMKQAKIDGDTEKAKELDALQNSLKLIINTTYGCLASPYFPMGNTIVANNITDKARVGAWMMSKALLTKQSITDGGACSADEVAYLKPDVPLPGLDTLARRSRLVSHRSVVVKPLNPDIPGLVRDWLLTDNRLNPDRVAELNRIVTDHINAFWSRYNLTMPFSIEVKEDHSAEFMVYRGKADYLLINTIKSSNIRQLPNGESVTYVRKTRGVDNESDASAVHLWTLAYPEFFSFDNCVTVQSETMGVNQFKAIGQFDYPATPGDEVFTVKTYLPNPWRGYVATDEDTHYRLQDGCEKQRTRFKRKYLTDVKLLISEYQDCGKQPTIKPPKPYYPPDATTLIY
jgi:hypothetical protein